MLLAVVNELVYRMQKALTEDSFEARAGGFCVCVGLLWSCLAAWFCTKWATISGPIYESTGIP